VTDRVNNASSFAVELQREGTQLQRRTGRTRIIHSYTLLATVPRQLDLVLAVLSTGPVGVGDGINNTNFTLATSCCRADGAILKPNRPLTAMDALFVPNAAEMNHVGFLRKANAADGDCTASRPCSPAAHQTHAAIALSPTYVKHRLLESLATVDL